MTDHTELEEEQTTSGETAHRYEVFAESPKDESFPALILDTVGSDYTATWYTTIDERAFTNLLSMYLDEIEDSQVVLDKCYSVATVEDDVNGSIDRRRVSGTFESIMSRDFLDIEYLGVQFKEFTLSWVNTESRVRLTLDSESHDTAPLEFFFTETPFLPLTTEGSPNEIQQVDEREQRNVTSEVTGLIRQRV